MTGNYARLGMLATAGKLATGAQAERGATMRTACSLILIPVQSCRLLTLASDHE